MHAVIVVATWFAQALYALLKLLPQRRKVVFLSRQSDHPSRDFKMLASQLEALDPSIDVVVRCKFIHPDSLTGQPTWAKCLLRCITSPLRRCALWTAISSR